MIDTFISSSILILMILAIRVAFKGRVNPFLQYSLWGLVVLRLAAASWLTSHPIQSAFSVINLTGKASHTIRQTAQVEQVLRGEVPARAIDQGVIMMDNLGAGIVTKGEGITAAAAIDWQLVLFVIWLLGAVLLIGIFTYTNLRFQHKLVQNRKLLRVASADVRDGLEGVPPLKIEERRPSAKTLSVYVVEGLDSPCLMHCKGETAIYVTPSVAENGEMLHYAITHELCHFKHHDLIWSMIRGCLLVIYWMNPLVWVAAIMSKRDCELACDYAVLKAIGEESRLNYGKSLLDLISGNAKRENVFCMATTMGSSVRGIRERITMIARKTRWRKSTLLAVLLIAALSVGCTFTASKGGPEKPADKGDLKMAEFAEEWATAYSDRNARNIYELTANEELYLKIGHKEADGTLWMGLSSPWPWEKDHVIDVIDEHRAEIYYYFRTSEPTIFMAKETIVVEEVDGAYKVVEESLVSYDEIKSKADFDAAYKLGFPNFLVLSAGYQSQADTNEWNTKSILEDPMKAARHQLNLSGANPQDAYIVEPKDTYVDPYIKSAIVTFAFPDGEVTVPLIQPVIEDEKGVEKQGTVWVVVDENELRGLAAKMQGQ